MRSIVCIIVGLVYLNSDTDGQCYSDTVRQCYSDDFKGVLTVTVVRKESTKIVIRNTRASL